MARDIRVVFTGNADDLLKAAAESDLALESVSKTADSSGSSWKKFSGYLTTALPIIAGAGVGILGLTGNLSSLGVVVPVLTTGLGLLLAPLTTLAAILVALVGPVVTLTGLLGLLGAGFFFAAKKAFGSGGALHSSLVALEKQFGTLTSTLASRFMPVFRFLISSASDALGYLNRIAKLPLAQAFRSLSTTGIAGLKHFLEQVGHFLANPIRLAFRFAFGLGGSNANSALGSLFDQIKHFFSSPPPGGKISIDQMFVNWFNEHDFTKTGTRWGMELAASIIQALGSALKAGLGARGIGFAAGGGALGAAIGGPLGAGIGVAAGIALNHYWPRIVSTAKQVWSTVKTFAVSEFHAITTALEHFLGPTTWSNLGAIAKSTWNIIKTVAIGAFHAIIATARTIWQVFDTIVIKTGLWKVALAVVKAAIFVAAAVLRPIIAIIAKIVSVAVHLGSVFNGAVLAGVRAVASAIAAIVSGIQDAIGLASKLASALSAASLGSGSVGAPGHGTVPGRAGGSLPPGTGHVHVHFHNSVVASEQDAMRLVQRAITKLSRTGNPSVYSGRTLR